MSNITVKLEVWDIVDKAKKKSSGSNLKLRNIETGEEEFYEDDPEQAPQPRADAETINVLKGTNAVIFMMDPRKKWTFQYIQREVPLIPPEVDILIIVSVC